MTRDYESDKEIRKATEQVLEIAEQHAAENNVAFNRERAKKDLFEVYDNGIPVGAVVFHSGNTEVKHLGNNQIGFTQYGQDGSIEAEEACDISAIGRSKVRAFYLVTINNR